MVSLNPSLFPLEYIFSTSPLLHLQHRSNQQQPSMYTCSTLHQSACLIHNLFSRFTQPPLTPPKEPFLSQILRLRSCPSSVDGLNEVVIKFVAFSRFDILKPWSICVRSMRVCERTLLLSFQNRQIDSEEQILKSTPLLGPYIFSDPRPST